MVKKNQVIDYHESAISRNIFIFGMDEKNDVTFLLLLL